MADIGEAIYSRLTNDSTVSDLVSTRVYPYQPEQAPTHPYITYHMISLVERPHAMGSDPSLIVHRYQVDCWSDTYAGMVNLGEAVMAALNRWRGTEASVTVDATFHVDSRDLFEDEVRIYRRSFDFEIAWYQ